MSRETKQILTPPFSFSSSEHSASINICISEHEQPLLILFVFMGLALGGILRQVNRKTKIPYTPMLIVTGIFVGCYRDSLGFVGKSAELMSHINPHMILFVFIPVLIFESGFNCDWYVFKRAMVNILILAVPGVLVGAFILGFCLKVLLGYDNDLSWNGALTMGAILCATDPVAVVALLKELGASVRFNTLIEGESLLNDGTAMVFFQVFFSMEKGQEATPAGITVNFIRLAGGGPTVGFLCGIFGSFWLRRLIRDDVLTSTVTFITCYLCFYLAEFTFLHVSGNIISKGEITFNRIQLGILALVVLGLFMSAHGRTKIYSESEHSVHTVWSFVQYGCETIIFLLTGVIVGKEMIAQDSITFSDWMKLPVFWVLMVLARGIMVFVFLPFLKYFGYGINRAEMWVLIWGGLRGALGLTLALMVAVDEDLLDEVKYPRGKRLRQLTIFYMSGVATLTLLINGTTCGALVNYLGMIEVPKIRGRIVMNSLRNLSNECHDKCKELQMNTFLNMADWKKVNEISGVDEITQSILQASGGAIELAGGEMMAIDLKRRSTYSSFDVYEISAETRFRLLRTLKTYIWEGFESGYLGAAGVQLLNECVDVALDTTRQPLRIWSTIYSNFTDFTVRFSFQLRNWPLIGGVAKNYLTHHLAFVYEVTTAFISSAQEAEELVHNMPLGHEYIKNVNGELKGQVNEAQKYISDLQLKFPEIITSIHTKRAASALIETQKRFLATYKERGYIDECDFNEIRKKVDERIIQLENMTFSWQDVSELHSFDTFVLRFPVFSSLTPQEIRLLENSHKSFLLPAGSEIYRQGCKFDYLYVVTSGTVCDVLAFSDSENSFTMTKGMGAFLSFANCVNTENTRSISTATAQTESVLYGIPFATIKGIMMSNKVFERKVYLNSMSYFIRIFPEKAGPLKGMEENHLSEYVVNSMFLSLLPDTNCVFENGGYLITGSVEWLDLFNQSSVEVVQEFTYIQPSNKVYKITRNSQLLKFQDVLFRKLSVMDQSFEEEGHSRFNFNAVTHLKKQYISEQKDL